MAYGKLFILKKKGNEKMNIYLLSQDENKNYYRYDSAVVAAKNEEQAIYMAGCRLGIGDTWTDDAFVKIKLIGSCAQGIETGIICAAFNIE